MTNEDQTPSRIQLTPVFHDDHDKPAGNCSLGPQSNTG